MPSPVPPPQRGGLVVRTLLYVSGLFALYVACKPIAGGVINRHFATTLRVAAVPASIGGLGVIHGYISVAFAILAIPAGVGTLGIPHLVIWATFLVGATFSLIAATIVIAIECTSRLRHLD